MLPQMAFTSSIAFVALLLCFSFSVNPQPENYPTKIAPASWNNSPSFKRAFTFNGGETIRSILFRLNATNGMSFATGFYCLPPCKRFFLSIYIIHASFHENGYWYESSDLPQVIWSANRAHPVSENATLQLTSKDGLTLHDSDGSRVWSTSGLDQSVAGISITEAGNLVLFDINNFPIWQSFDYPTDCLVMGQTLRGDMRITSNSSSTDLAESQFYLTLLVDGLYGYVNSNPPLVYYHYHPTPHYKFYRPSDITVDNYTFINFINGSLKLSNTNRSIIAFNFPLAISIQYMRLESDGHLRVYDYDNFQWEMVGDLFHMDDCSYPTVCGHYGICDNGQCTCPTGTLGNYFKPVDNRRADLGCTAVTNITCQDVNNHRLLDLNNVSYFNSFDNVAFDTTDEETCKKACLGDCKCKAVMFQSTNGNSLVGRCLTLPEVFSFQNIQPENQFNSTAYIKVQVVPPPSSSNVGLEEILGSTFGALLLIITLISFYILCLRRREEAEDEDVIEKLPGMPTRFTLVELRAATENFVKILGKGGFGTVFEGRWGDERIAVKRLDNVEHGKKDFLAEVETIGSIHHINLTLYYIVKQSGRKH
ncbi:hypothetical protein FCM35_KLT09545 [Carex littledalei]|uniref:non-specific serine/threonine protein kinase n=1 Tax=Carex littledalei TaxID=544730 RepID=A0A833RRT0_9POAL|nr:hypothetical protein FCM35_KLT09545 [Carex littledalei]